ncbi:AAA family ATPase [Companilactobacillus bobalius]|uniref:Nuclease SbcCD subunit C n=2 Tax=Companilactobacillus bobalius TaxID=2801451 RepID=A0A202F9M5_9LACO|nr:SMC family ATPase [Companilactobacillus bobalius]KAE9558831.1 exonuclease SbcC [Companilactobacillus bobalius]OVE97176.1 Nuclease SbcCD subunit [Companilactobacillus bobalius]GEO59598.1 nuclease SbcCD subunit C [Companilactobacillus paralimentarius]
MKPIYLQMNYFGPHENSSIDFRKLDEAPIFLIGGDTGAGKSTIFDAMTFALFGSTTTDGRDAREMRSQFAPNDKATEVTFYFEQGNNLYRIVRRPEQWLKSQRGDNLVDKKPIAKLAIVDKVGGTEIDSIAAKPSDVGTAIAGILNLSAEQFKKIILLPQNDFSKFLKSKTDAKEAILKKIFGTQLYSDFASKLKELYSADKKKNETFATDLAAQLDSDNWTDEEKEQLSHESDEQKIVVLESFVNKRQTEFNSVEKQATELNKQVQTADKNFQNAKDLDKQFSDLDTAKHDYQLNIVNKESEISAQQQHVSELQWADDLKDSLRDLDSKNEELKKTNDRSQKLTVQMKLSQKDYQSATTKNEELIAQKDDFDQKENQSKKLAILIPDIERIERIRKEITKQEPELLVLQKNLSEQNEEFQKITSQIDAKKESLIDGDKLQTQKDALTREKDDFVETLTPLENLQLNNQKEVKRLQTHLDELKSQLQSKTENLQQDQADFQEKKGHRQALMIAQLQKELVDGEPCVVCGSTDHSHMIKTIDADETELKASMEQVDKSQNQFASAQKEVETVNNNISETTTELNAAQDNLKTATQKLNETYLELTDKSELTFATEFNLSASKSIFDKKIASLTEQLAAANKLTAEIEKLTKDSQKIADKQNEFKLDLATKKSALEANQKDLKQTLAKLGDENRSSQEITQEIKTLDAAVKDYQEQVTETQKVAQDSQIKYSNNKTQLDDVEKQAAEQKVAIEKLQENIDSVLSDSDAKTNDIKVLRTWIAEINDGVLSELQIKISNYKQEKTRLEKRINELSTALTNKEKPDLETLRTVLTGLQTKKDELISQVANAKRTFQDADKNLKRIKDIIAQQGDFAKKFSQLSDLYNIVNGQGNNDSKLKLETYVVQNYLQKVLNYANDHFINLLSNNRYTFELSADPSDKMRDHGLDINIFDNETGKSRSSDTLSGGETFIAALSIALSLSEVVQSSSNGVQIDALFVDEGFGSLDDETLEKSMTALETIGQNRMVGVISHIESMKQTIGQQVLIKKLGDGRSKVEIVNK